MSHSSSKSTIFFGIAELLRIHHRQERMVGGIYGSVLTATEGFLLVELDVDQSRSLAELAELLQVNKSSASRARSSLLRKGYLASGRQVADGRRKPVTFSNKGVEFLAYHDRFNAELIKGRLARITAAELQTLLFWFGRLNDNLGVPVSLLRPREHRVLREVRRLSRAFEIFGPSLAGSGYPVDTWQMLEEIRLGGGRRRAVDLEGIFRLRQNTVSQILKRLSDQHLVKSERDPGDRRNQRLRLALKGQRVRDQIRAAVAGRLALGLTQYPLVELRCFAGILELYVGS